MVGTTDRTKTQPCSTCGANVVHRENFGAASPTAKPRTFWSPKNHDAPCGWPCIGGGVSVVIFRSKKVHGRQCSKCAEVSP